MRSKRVLIADDDPSIRRLLMTLVKREGIELDSAEDGVEAIEKLEKNDYGLILLDLMMPRINGFGVIDYLRDHSRPQKPIVFIISAYADHTYRTTDATIVSGVLHKPFDVDEVGTLIRLIVKGGDDAVAAALRNSKTWSIREFVEASEGLLRKSSNDS
ncbi:MAG TPA: response regulator [Thermoanaerobaculia bacterium]|nr:response regulator [Thermoanaerobaculia bacterium]